MGAQARLEKLGPEAGRDSGAEDGAVETLAQGVWQWLRACPELSDGIGVDYLKDGAGAFALRALPSALNVRRNICGDLEPLPEQTQDFALAHRAPCGQQARQSLDSLRRLGRVAAWIAAQNAAGRLPLWDGGTVTGVVADPMAALTQAGADTARYELRMRFYYRA